MAGRTLDFKITSVFSALCFGAGLLCIGCSQGTSTAGADSAKGEARVASASQSRTEQHATAGSSVGNLRSDPSHSDPQSEQKELVRELAEVSRLAGESQRQLDFAVALKSWNRCVEILTALHGRDSWQARNAAEFLRVCQAQSKFNESQRQDLSRLLMLQDQIASELKNNTYAEALALSRQATELSAKIYANDRFLMGKQLTQLGRMEQLSGNFAVAFGHYQESLRLLTECFGEEHPDVETLQGYLGETALAQKQTLQAVDYYKTARTLAGKIWGESSLEVALRTNELGNAFHRLRDLETASKLLRSAESIRRERLGAEHPLVGHSLYNLAVIYLDMNRLEMAEQCLEQALEIFRAKLPLSNPVAAECQLKLATTWMLLGKPQQAETALEELVALSTSTNIPPDQLSIWNYRLAIAYAKQQKYAEAEPLLVKVMGEQEQLFGANHADTVRTRNALATLYAQTNRQELAEKLGNQVQPAGFSAPSNGFER